MLSTSPVFPRSLRLKERDLLYSVLPPDRPGYKRYLDLVNSMVVIGEGRRGAGNFILGYDGDVPDLSSPLASVVAYGVVETTRESISVTVRECIADQIDVEIVSSRGGEVPDHLQERRLWTYSTWQPGAPSPANNKQVREVVVEDHIVLVMSRDEKRLWVYDGTVGMNFLIPITNFYNELMLLKNIRDPKIALAPQLLFADLDTYSDQDLRATFVAYNTFKRRVDIRIHAAPQGRRRFSGFLKKWFRKET